MHHRRVKHLLSIPRIGHREQVEGREGEKERKLTFTQVFEEF